MSPESPLQVARSFSDFDRITAPSFEDLPSAQIPVMVGDQECPPYLDTMSSNGGVAVQHLEAMYDLWLRSTGCKKTANKFDGCNSYKVYYKFFPCLKWWCPDCGKRKGTINMKRMFRILDRIDQDVKNTLLRQIVFTLPAENELEFMGRPALNSLFKMAERITKKLFPGLKCIAALHLFGDKGEFRFRPHVHILVFYRKGSLKMLPRETLDTMRDLWRRALRAYLRRSVKVVDVNYSFASEPKKILHHIRYVSRPCPGPKDYKRLKKNLPLLKFCMLTLQGFIFIRYFNGCKGKGIKDHSIKDEMKEAAGLAGEKLIFVPNGQISRAEFDMRFRPGDYDELSPGFYRIHGP